MVKKEVAPIYTADGKPVVVGMTVYGFDLGCKEIKADPKGYITPLVVAEIDHGRSRMVRLRKPNGREWRWYAEESRVHCSNDFHLIYASLAELKKVAVPAVQKLIESETAKNVASKEDQLKYAEEEVSRRKESLAKAMAGRSEGAKAIAAMKRLKVSDMAVA